MVAFSIGSLHIYRYGIFYFISFILGYIGFKFLAKKKYFAKSFPWIQNILEKHTEDLLIFILLGVMLGGRLGNDIIYYPQYFLQHPAEILAFRKGGMSFIGGIFGVVVAILLFRKWQKGKKYDLRMLFDILLLFLPIGIALGRFGNYLNQELYGVVASDRLPRPGYPLFSLLRELNIFHVYPAVDEFLRINTNFLALFREGIVTFVIGLLVIHSQIRRKLFHPGMRSAIFLLRYSFVRFFLEYYRADSQLEFRGAFTISQWFFIGFFMIGLVLLWKFYKNRK
ncbi:MAG: prolipoprotein diacylglyceryl transferase [Candidatus Absconditabacterales bacterium]